MINKKSALIIIFLVLITLITPINPVYAETEECTNCLYGCIPNTVACKGAPNSCGPCPAGFECAASGRCIGEAETTTCPAYCSTGNGFGCVPGTSICAWTQEEADGVGGRNNAAPELGEGFDLGGLLTTIYKIMFPVAVLLGIILTIKAGYIFMTSQGDPRKVQEGKEGLTSAIMGLLFVLLSVTILRIIIGTLITGSGPGF